MVLYTEVVMPGLQELFRPHEHPPFQSIMEKKADLTVRSPVRQDVPEMDHVHYLASGRALSAHQWL